MAKGRFRIFVFFNIISIMVVSIVFVNFICELIHFEEETQRQGFSYLSFVVTFLFVCYFVSHFMNNL